MRHWRKNIMTPMQKKDMLDKKYQRIEKLVSWMRNFKVELGCQHCGEKRWQCLDFHHLEKKKYNISTDTIWWNGWGKKRLLEEMKKCLILCSNCHRIETHRTHGYSKKNHAKP